MFGVQGVEIDYAQPFLDEDGNQREEARHKRHMGSLYVVILSTAAAVAYWSVVDKEYAPLFRSLSLSSLSLPILAQNESSPPDEVNEDITFIVPKDCLVVMIVAAAIGGTVTYFAAWALLAVLGFTGIGPALGSAAAAWQSAGFLMPLFSALQSAAMGGAGIWAIITTGVASGAACAGAAHNFCDQACPFFHLSCA